MWNLRVVPVCRNVVVTGVRCEGRGRNSWSECVNDDTDELGFCTLNGQRSGIFGEASYLEKR